MLSFSGGLKIFVALEPSDMRKSFNGLHTAVHEKLRADPLSGALFLFSNKKRNLMKIPVSYTHLTLPTTPYV